MRVGHFKITVETERLIRLLRETEIGEIVSYEDMSSTINIDVQKDGRGYLNTARKKLLNEGILFETVRGLGIKRCDTNGWVNHAEHSRVKVRRISAKSLRASLQMPQEEYEKLERDEKTQLDISRTILAFASEAAKNKTAKALQPAVESMNTRLSVKETIKALSKKKEEQ